MRISVIGCGYLGAVHVASMGEFGHEVVGNDVDAAKVAQLADGRPPFHEPGFPELLSRSLASGRVRFSADIAEAAGLRRTSSASALRRSGGSTRQTSGTSNQPSRRC